MGRLEGLQQPTRNLSGWYPNYNAEIYNNATDLIRAYALRETDEPEYTTFNKCALFDAATATPSSLPDRAVDLDSSSFFQVHGTLA